MKPNNYEPQNLLLEEVIERAPSLDVRAAPRGIERGLIVDLLETGEIEVVIPPDDVTRIRCDFLETSSNVTLSLQVGDRVLVMRPAGPGQNGCVLGRIGRYRDPDTVPNPTLDHVVIQANEMLTLKCGESSVDLRKDGKVMVRGNDVLTRAKRTNRIKGGNVAIN